MEEKLFISGIGSGLGRYLYENLGGIGFTREKAQEELSRLKYIGVDSIIHCAFNSKRNIDLESLYSYLEDNVFLTRQLTEIPHKKFIFISTVDVYQKDGELHRECDKIFTDKIYGLYPLTKLMSESIVRKNCDNYLILRPTALLGKYSRKNSLIRILEGATSVSISCDSEFNYILHSDILKFIKIAIENDFKGTYNVASSDNIKISEVADLLGKKVRFGKYKYDVGNIDKTKVANIYTGYRKSSKEIIKGFCGFVNK